MNLVDLIKDQLTSQITNKLASLVGGSEEQTNSAIGAAVPAMLSAISGLASKGGSSADDLAATINQYNSGSLEEMTGRLTEDADQSLEQGSDLLGSLFSGSTVSALIGALSKFAGLDSGSLKKLLAYVAPLVMGAIAKHFQGRPATAQGLTSLFAEQQANIANAMPAGLSLAGIPGLSDARSATESAARTASRTADAARETTSPFVKSLLPLAALALLALLAWQFMRGRDEAPEVQEMADAATEHTAQRPVTDPADSLPDVTKFTNDLTSAYTTATETLNGITDVASAESALPKLDELSTQIDSLAAMQEKLSETARSKVGEVATEFLGKLEKLIEKVLAIPGVKEKLEPVLNPIMKKLRAFTGGE